MALKFAKPGIQRGTVLSFQGDRFCRRQIHPQCYAQTFMRAFEESYPLTDVDQRDALLISGRHASRATDTKTHDVTEGHVQAGIKAIDAINKQDSLELYYSFASVLMRHALLKQSTVGLASATRATQVIPALAAAQT
ncbi:putative vacuolar membrane protein [Pseudozyma hubeiensis]|nr:putative vacuolar membrane protein [Pseudozyma hubeiensis]